MKNYTITICTNNEHLRGSRTIDEGLLQDACVEACDAATDIFDRFGHTRSLVEFDSGFVIELDTTDDADADPAFDVTLDTNGTFSDWNGGRMSGDQYFRVTGAQKHGNVVIKCDDIDAEIPQEFVVLAEAMHKAISDTLDEHDDETDSEI